VDKINNFKRRTDQKTKQNDLSDYRMFSENAKKYTPLRKSATSVIAIIVMASPVSTHGSI